MTLAQTSGRRRRFGRATWVLLALALVAAVGDAWLRTGGPARPGPTPTATAGAAAGAGPPDPSAPALAGTDTEAGLVSAQQAEERRPGTRGWLVGSTAGRRPGLDGYADQVSVLPGQPVRLFISSATEVTVRAFRVGWYGGTGAREVWAGRATGGRQPEPTVDQGTIPGAGGLHAAHLVRAGWLPSITVSTTGWPEGNYLIRLDAGAASRYVPLTVRSASTAGRVVLLAAPMTWQAYNAWGGASLYGDEAVRAALAQAVSFDRPYLDGFGSGRFLTYDGPLFTTIATQGLPLAWVTDWDLAQNPGLLDGAAALVVGGHAEYWTAGMRDGVTAAVGHGTNLAIFGANTAYWRVRLAGQRTIVATKAGSADPLAAADPHGATGRFRDAPGARPEELLTGMRYDCFPAAADWVVADPGWWGYAGTGLRQGSRLNGLVGPEADRAYQASDRPRPEQVVAYVRYPCGGRGLTAHTGVYWVAPSGAGVFVAGTMRWPCAVDVECRYVPSAAQRTLVRRITANVVTAFAAARAGRQHPAIDTVDRFWLPALSTTGAS